MAEVVNQHKTHIQQVDYIRAIASLAVALFHLGGKALPVLNYGWLGVQMFFLLSGFIICHSMPHGYSLQMSGRFISRRLIRIEPPYIISVASALLLKFILVINYQPDWLNVLFHLAYINNFFNGPYLNPVYWTLGIEFQFYLFIAFCFPLLATKVGPWLLPVLCIAFMYCPVPGATLFNSFPPFALGILYYLYLTKITGKPQAIILGILIAAYFVWYSGWLSPAAALLSLAILILPLKTNRVVSFFSKISFSLYLTHDIVGSNLVVYLGNQLPKTLFYKGIEFISGIIVSIVFAWLFYLLIERTFLKLSKQIAYK